MKNNKEHCAEYGLVVRFHDQSESYVLGFEAGLLWRDLEKQEPVFKRAAHTKNLPTLMAIAKHFKHDLIIDDCGLDITEWAEITAIRDPATKPFKLVK